MFVHISGLFIFAGLVDMITPNDANTASKLYKQKCKKLSATEKKIVLNKKRSNSKYKKGEFLKKILKAHEKDKLTMNCNQWEKKNAKRENVQKMEKCKDNTKFQARRNND
ncbi:hypothetical protein RFI_29495 [Reticulomyxa filosa]|uniref:Secreted protein n=1 Tax=Reticulomyxa filosa TaxID=46433 RepID=X6M4F5_RETFI|nr:hypothetical protein RFI_29495 [Reticulomyxa filosa]|eukprot:ETO07895.1 hypothetical protein RFI_29495 [Reticulomyxa filosa]